LQHKRTSLADERTALARDNQLRHRVHDFAARIHAVIGTLDNTQKQQLMRLLIEDVRVTGWHVQIRLRVALDPPPPDPTGPPNPEGKPSPHPRPVSSQDGLRSFGGHGLVILTGCGHAGIVNIVRYAHRLTGVDTVAAIVGGFHLSGPAFEPAIQPTIDALAEIGAQTIIPAHCTGWRAAQALAARMPDASPTASAPASNFAPRELT
jgi:hypothetical protein